MVQAVLNQLFPCVHKRTTFPQTRSRTPLGTLPRTYVACLDCGREFAYDWESMRLCPRSDLTTPATERQRSWRHRGAEAATDARPTAESELRHYLGRAAQRFRKVKVALRVLSSLMAGAAAQPDDMALLASWTDPESRGRSPGELAR